MLTRFLKMKNALKVYSIGSAVQWKWMGRYISGTVRDIFTEPVSKLIKGKTIKRNGSTENPAYLVESSQGNLALKLHTELEAFEKNNASPSRPTMFRS